LVNNVEQAAELEPYFDWALNESCLSYNECETLLPFVAAGKAVIGVAYEDDPAEFGPTYIDFDWLGMSTDLGVEKQARRYNAISSHGI